MLSYFSIFLPFCYLSMATYEILVLISIREFEFVLCLQVIISIPLEGESPRMLFLAILVLLYPFLTGTVGHPDIWMFHAEQWARDLRLYRCIYWLIMSRKFDLIVHVEFDIILYYNIYYTIYFSKGKITNFSMWEINRNLLTVSPTNDRGREWKDVESKFKVSRCLNSSVQWLCNS